MTSKHTNKETRQETNLSSRNMTTILVDRTAVTPKASGRRQSKVRTGCFTCKARRVKCGEEKPNCIRCVKLAIQCEGYPASSKQVTLAVSRVILPKGRPSPGTRSSKVNHGVLLSGCRFLDENEKLCFRLYCDEIADQLRGPFQTSLWDRLIPQASQTEPFIRHAVVGLGALAKIQQEIARTRTRGSRCTTVPDYSYALSQYGKSLQGVRTSITTSKPEINKLLIACILVFCFETMYGRPGPAIASATSGMMLLLNCLENRANQSAEFFLSNEWCAQSTEEDLMAALAGLDLQVLFFFDNRPESTHWFMINEANKIVPQIPAQFDTVRGARKFWSLIMRRNFHFIKIALTRSKSHQLAGHWKYSSEAPWEDCLDLFPGGNMFSTPKEPALELLDLSVLYQKDIDKWNASCARLFERTQKHGTTKDKIIVAMLRMHSLVSQVMLAAAFFETEIQYDVFFPEFREILVLLEYLHPHVTGKGNLFYQFELGIIIGLHLIGCRCRDRETRDKAMSLMAKKEFREGFWDTGVGLIFVKTVRDAEEESRDEMGLIPEHKRTFAACVFVDLAGRRGVLGYVKRGLEGLEFYEKFYQY